MKPANTNKRGAKKAPRPSNVYDIGDNPRFSKRQISIPKLDNSDIKLVSYAVTKNQFGFIPGDRLICREEFDESEFTDNTMVIRLRMDGTKQLTTYGTGGIVIAVVIAFRREVAL